MNGLTVNAGASTINNATANTLALGALTARNVGGVVNFNSGTSGTITTAATNDASGILGAWATYGGTSYATVSGGTIVAYSGATQAMLVGDINSATTNYSVPSGTTFGTLNASSTGNTLQFQGPSASSLTPNSTGGLTLNGILAAWRRDHRQRRRQPLRRLQ